MKTYTSQLRQSLLDVAIAATGDVEQVYDIATRADMAITDLPAAGTVFEFDSVVDPTVLDAFSAAAIQPATAVDDTFLDTLVPQGIGYWTIGADFAVS
jgi:hypothetical protein